MLIDSSSSYGSIAGDLHLGCDDLGLSEEPSVGSTCQPQASDEPDPQDSEEQETMSQLPESYIEEESNVTSCLKPDLEYTTEKVALQFLLESMDGWLFFVVSKFLLYLHQARFKLGFDPL